MVIFHSCVSLPGRVCWRFWTIRILWCFCFYYKEPTTPGWIVIPPQSETRWFWGDRCSECPEMYADIVVTLNKNRQWEVGDSNMSPVLFTWKQKKGWTPMETLVSPCQTWLSRCCDGEQGNFVWQFLPMCFVHSSFPGYSTSFWEMCSSNTCNKHQ